MPTTLLSLSITYFFLLFQGKPVDDGSHFVWSILNKTESKYEYVSTDSLPKLACFKLVPNKEVIWGDIAWWKDAMGFYDATNASVLTSQGSVLLDRLEEKYGKVIFYRYVRTTENDSTKVN